jgi:hypothetical protein
MVIRHHLFCAQYLEPIATTVLCSGTGKLECQSHKKREAFVCCEKLKAITSSLRVISKGSYAIHHRRAKK